MKRLFIAGVIGLFLTACGGGNGAGSDNSTVPVAATPAPPLSAYIGNWVSSCNGHEINSRTIARMPGTTDSVSIAFRVDYYAYHNCKGAVVGTFTQSANATVVYAGTVESSILFTLGSAAVPARVDKVIASMPQTTWSVTGTGVVYTAGGDVPEWCINYLDGDGSCVADPGVVSAGVINLGALYLEGNVLYLLSWNGSSYSVGWALSRQ